MLQVYEHLIGGVAGGVASTLICHPFDLLRIRYSANEGNPSRPQYGSYANSVRSIVRAGGYRALYQGLSPSIIAAPLSWGMYFHLFHRVKAHINNQFPSLQSNAPLLENLSVGCACGALVLLVTNPLWVCKTRLCLQYESTSCPRGQRPYRGLAHCLQRIWREEGIRGMYRGFGPGLIGTTNGSVQFALYNWMKDWRCAYSDMAKDSQLSAVDYLIFSSASKVLSTVFTFPYQLLRTRLQDQYTSYKGMIDCTAKTLRREGFLGLYKGVLMATAKQLPNSIVTYVVYEETRHFLEKL